MNHPSQPAPSTQLLSSADPAVLACVLLAAGAGTRLGGHKPLALLAGRPLCLYAAETALASRVGPVVMVVPPGQPGQDIRAALGSLAVTFTENPAPTRGLLSSFQVALPALELELGLKLGPDIQGGVIFGLADMPFVTAQTYRRLHDLYHHQRPPLVLTRYGNELLAPPHLFRADLWPELLALPDADQGPRPLLQRYAKQALYNDRPIQESFDVDTPQALALAEQRFRPASPATGEEQGARATSE